MPGVWPYRRITGWYNRSLSVVASTPRSGRWLCCTTRRRIQTRYDLESAQSNPELYLDYIVSRDGHRRITSVKNRTYYDGAELARFDFTRDAVGNPPSNQGNRGTGSNAAGFSKIQKIPDYVHDTLHRLTQAD